MGWARGGRVLVLVAMVLAACRPEATVPEGAGGADTPPAVTIAVVSHTQDPADLFGQLQVGLEDTLTAAGLTYDLISGAPAASDDHEGMARILTDLQTVAPDYLVVGPSSFERNQPYLLELERAGTTIIMTDYPPPGGTIEIDPLTWVIYDHHELGSRSVAAVAQQLCDEGRAQVEVAVFWGPPDSEISELRGSGALAALEDHREACDLRYELTAEVTADFDRETAFGLALEVLDEHPGTEVWIGTNSSTALGISEALLTAGALEGRRVVGMGGQLDELAAICRGEIAAAAFRDPRAMGQLVAEAVLADLAGRPGEVPEVTLAELPVLTDCDAVFASVPRPMLEQEAFRGALLDGQWQDRP